MTPVLRQYADLTLDDFDAAPVWVGCHGLDHNESWYDCTDEETFRPWDGRIPVDPAEGLFLVAAIFKLSDERKFRGFLTPANCEVGESLGVMQPHLWAGSRFFGFWGGMLGVSAEVKQAFYATLDAEAEHLFPIAAYCKRSLTSGLSTCSVEGFYRSPDLDQILVEP